MAAGYLRVSVSDLVNRNKTCQEAIEEINFLISEKWLLPMPGLSCRAYSIILPVCREWNLIRSLE
jgi:hypothetical protein